MSTTTTQQADAVIVKGISSQLLQMNLPSIYQADLLFKEFGYRIVREENLKNTLDKDVVESMILALVMCSNTNLVCYLGDTYGEKVSVIMDIIQKHPSNASGFLDCLNKAKKLM